VRLTGPRDYCSTSCVEASHLEPHDERFLAVVTQIPAVNTALNGATNALRVTMEGGYG
jgi:hypothetical protein